MSDFDNVKIGDWVRIQEVFAKSGPTLAYMVVTEGVVTDRDECAKMLRITADGVAAYVCTSPADPGVTVRLVEHRPDREVGWHEVELEVGAAVRWWDGAWWRYSPTGPSTGVDYGSGHYLGRGSQ